MPELPEVETMVRGIRPYLENRVISNVRRCRCAKKPILITPSLQKIRKRVKGETIIQVYRLAKRIVIQLSNDDNFVIEPRMTGIMLVDDFPTRDHLRVEWSIVSSNAHNSNQVQRVWFWDRRGLGTVRLYSSEELKTELGPNKLGPDALAITATQWKELCSSTSRPVKVALLDQKLVAGIGNLYASEILHRARISPLTGADKLSAPSRKKLAEATRFILKQAILYEGSTLSDGTYRNALNQSGGYQNAHLVYDREGELCQTCQAEPIIRIVQNQRSTFFCPYCQR